MLAKLKNYDGFTLVEMMAATLVTMVGLIGLLQAINVATEHNVKNQLRDEAGEIAGEQLRYASNRPFNLVSTSRTIESNIRGFKKAYTVNIENLPVPNSSARELVVKVAWSYKNVSSHYELRTVKAD